VLIVAKSADSHVIRNHQTAGFRIHSSDVVPLTNTALQRDRQLRYVVRPHRACAAPHDRLSLRLPKRLHMHRD